MENFIQIQILVTTVLPFRFIFNDKNMKTIAFILLIVLLKSGFSQVAIIVHPDVPVDSLSKNNLLDLYTGDIREWDNNQPIVTYDLKPKLEVRNEFFRLLGKTSSRMKSIWLKKMLAGEGDPPAALRVRPRAGRRPAHHAGRGGGLAASEGRAVAGRPPRGRRAPLEKRAPHD